MKTRRICASLLATAGLAAGACSSSHPAPTTAAAATTPSTVVIQGTLTLGIASFINGDDSPICVGYTGYTDITAGAPIVIGDQSGTTIATGQLAAGHVQGSGSGLRCAFAFDIAAPAGKSFYTITISHRGTQTFSADQIKQAIMLTLGN